MHLLLVFLCSIAVLWLSFSALVVLVASIISFIDVTLLGAPPLLRNSLIATGRRPRVKSFSVVSEPSA